MDSKAEIRKRILQARNAMTREEIAAGSLAIVKRLADLEEIRRASTLMVYLGFGSEVLTDGLILWGWGEGKRIVVPLCRPESRELTACRIDGFDELGERSLRDQGAEGGLHPSGSPGGDRGGCRPRRGLRPAGIPGRVRRRLL